MNRSLRVDAVVLRHTDWGEADRMLVLYTREAGKLRAIAKGARKLRSRKAGHLEPFTRVILMLARGRDLWIVTQASTVEAYQPVRDDLLKTGYAAYVIELLDRFTYEEGENSGIYRLIVETLQRISESAGKDKREETNAIFLAVRYFEIRLLDLLGFRPQLQSCVNCGREIRAVDQFFSAEMGGVVCPDCGGSTAGLRPVSMQALKYLRHFQRSSFAEVQRAAPTEPVQREMEAILQHYLTHLLERRLNSTNFIRDVKAGYEAGEE